MSEPTVFTVVLNDKPEYQRLYPGKPITCGMKAGRVHLQPTESCGEHSTEAREETLVFLQGTGRLIIGQDKQVFEVGQGRVAYIPPHTVHNIENSGSEPLIYIFCVSPVQ